MTGAAKDWTSSFRAYAIVWGVPLLAVIAGSFAYVPARTAIWSVSLIWMGMACLVNARRCGRMHCRFTGPFYLAMIIPVMLHGSGLLSFGSYAWWILGVTILIGGKVIWWTTEYVWGKYVD